MLEQGYVKVFRSITKWEWYKDKNTRALFLHLLLTVNCYDNKFQGIVVKRGQRIYSQYTLGDEISLSRQETRTAINHLKSTNEITISKNGRHSIITVNNYDLYQSSTSEPTSYQPRINQASTNDQPRSKKDKESKKEKNNISISPTTEKFNQFWSAYPNRVAKAVAIKAFCKLKPGDDLLNAIIAGVERWKASDQWSDPKYIPNPATFLNGRRWEDEIPKPSKATQIKTPSFDLEKYERDTDVCPIYQKEDNTC